uniref:Uncharacterized protein n=1 Tax=Romanomermis culicivorax TaxID=13658 RepID=A0A915J4Y0_ROMCU
MGAKVGRAPKPCHTSQRGGACPIHTKKRRRAVPQGAAWERAKSESKKASQCGSKLMIAGASYCNIFFSILTINNIISESIMALSSHLTKFISFIVANVTDYGDHKAMIPLPNRDPPGVVNLPCINVMYI